MECEADTCSSDLEDTCSSDLSSDLEDTCSSDLEEMLRNLPVIQLDRSILNRVRDESDSDDEDKIADEILWEVILDVPLRHWETAKVTEYNRVFLEPALRNAAKYKKDDSDYGKKIEEINCTLGDNEKFDYFKMLPRSPSPSRFYPWYRYYRMINTNPTSASSKRNTDLCGTKYRESGVLQFFSLKFSGDFLNGKPVSIYGFVAVRDEVDNLRNYVFNRSRKNAYEICPDSANIPLISPARGISTLHAVLIEYNIMVKMNDSDCAEEDLELIDGCFEFRHSNTNYHEVRDARMYGSLGPVDIRFVSFTCAVEASIDVKIKSAAKGYNNLKTITAFTTDFPNVIMLYDQSVSSPTTPKDGLSLLVLDSSIVAVEFDFDLILKFDFGTEDDPPHELTFTAQKYGISEKAIVIGRMLQLEAKVTWLTSYGMAGLQILNTGP